MEGEVQHPCVPITTTRRDSPGSSCADAATYTWGSSRPIEWRSRSTFEKRGWVLGFDFKGTFNTSGFKRFVAFATAQKADIAGRIVHLAAEQIRIGGLSFAYDGQGVPKEYVPEDDSYIGKLVAAYEVLGGDPFFDLNIRTRSQAVFLIPGDAGTPAQLMSNGEVMGLPGKGDAQSAELMDNARGWMDDVLSYKRDYLERKIRRAVDYAEQLQDEIDALLLVVQPAAVEGSLDNIFGAINQLLADPNYRAIYDDKGKDPNMKKVDAPLAIYGAGPDRAPDDLYQKDAGDVGVLDPGETVA